MISGATKDGWTVSLFRGVQATFALTIETHLRI